jgi:hypothetical protein
MTGSWMHLASGRMIDLLDPSPADIHLDDIATHLSKICRFAGALPVFYSVAQHSVLVSREVSSEYKLAALLHDAAEAYMGDIPRPVRHILGNAVAEIEDRLEKAIAHRFDICYPFPHAIRRADSRLLVSEKRDLIDGGVLKEDDLHWVGLSQYVPITETILPVSWRSARLMFLAEYDRIKRNEA